MKIIFPFSTFGQIHTHQTVHKKTDSKNTKIFFLQNRIYKIILFCFEFQIISRTEPRYSLALFSKNNSKTFWALPKFIIHKFSKFYTNTSISKLIQRGIWKTKTNFEFFNPFSFISLLSTTLTVPRCIPYH